MVITFVATIGSIMAITFVATIVGDGMAVTV
jgi:hypothetical protein